jgi:hypothetical protein
LSQTVWQGNTDAGHQIEVTWAGAQTALPTGALDPTVARRTRYFFDVLVDGTYYFGNRFLTSADAERLTDARGNPILSRTDLLLRLCADRVGRALELADLSSLPNDLGYVDLDALVALDGVHDED